MGRVCACAFRYLTNVIRSPVTLQRLSIEKRTNETVIKKVKYFMTNATMAAGQQAKACIGDTLVRIVASRLAKKKKEKKRFG